MFTFAFLLQAVNVADAVRESLEKHPSERTDYDVEIILNAIQHLQVCYCVVDCPVQYDHVAP